MVMLNTWNYLEKIIPIWQYLKKYDGNTAICDVVAGITVGLTLIPQVIAYASLAGLAPQYGLYSSLCGGLIYALFGTIPELNIAPTALLSLLTYQYTHAATFGNIKAAIMLTFFSGIIELFTGILHLGFLVDFVSIPVVSAFTSAGAITIGSSQIKNLFGLKFKAESFIDVWKNFFLNIGSVNLWDTILGFSCIGVLLALRQLKDYGTPPLSTGEKSLETKSGIFKKILWFLSVGRNALVVIVCAIMACLFQYHNYDPFSLTSKVPSGFPNISVPIKPIEASNGTNATEVFQMVSELGYGIVIVPFVSILANVGIAKAFAHGKILDASQEMIAVGLCNIVGSFFGSFPVNASFSRAAVNSASGVRTPLAGMYTGIMVIMAFSFLTPYFSYIPKPTLAAVIICAVIFMVEITITKFIWNINKLDLIPFIITLLSCLLIGIEFGIVIGTIVEIMKLLYFAARPKILLNKINGPEFYLKITLTSSVFFPSAEFIREKIFQYSMNRKDSINVILIDCTNIVQLDYTAGKCFASLINSLQNNGKLVAFLISKHNIMKILERSHLSKLNVYQTEEEFRLYLTGKVDEPVTNGDVESVVTQL